MPRGRRAQSTATPPAIVPVQVTRRCIYCQHTQEDFDKDGEENKHASFTKTRLWPQAQVPANRLVFCSESPSSTACACLGCYTKNATRLWGISSCNSRIIDTASDTVNSIYIKCDDPNHDHYIAKVDGLYSVIPEPWYQFSKYGMRDVLYLGLMICFWMATSADIASYMQLAGPKYLEYAYRLVGAVTCGIIVLEYIFGQGDRGEIMKTHFNTWVLATTSPYVLSLPLVFDWVPLWLIPLARIVLLGYLFILDVPRNPIGYRADTAFAVMKITHQR